MTAEEPTEAEQLAAAAKRFRTAESTMEVRRIELAALIRDAGTREEPPQRLKPSAIAKITGYTPEHVRRIIGGE